MSPSGTIRWRRWAVRSAAAVALLLILALTAVTLLVHSLDAPSLKARIQRTVHDQVGLDVDWEALRVDLLSGVRGRNLRAESPAALRSTAPDLARIGTLDVDWSLGSLLGSQPLRSVRIRDVALTLVQDDEAGGSLDVLSNGKPAAAPASPPAPLSETLSKVLAKPLPVGELTVESVALAQVHTGHGQLLERWSVEGIGVHVSGQTRVEVTAPQLAVSHVRRGAPDQSARGQLSVAVDASRDQARAEVELRVLQQDFLPNIPVSQLLRLSSTVKVDPRGHQLLVQVDPVRVADDKASLQAQVTLPDGRGPLIESATGNFDLGALSALAAAFDPPARVERGTLKLEARKLSVDTRALVPVDGALKVDADLHGLRAPPWDVQGVNLSAELSSAAGNPKGRVRLEAKGVEGAPGVAVPDVVLTVTLSDRSHAEVAVDSHRLEASGFAADDVHVDIRAEDLVVPPGTPLEAKGKLAASVRAGTLRLPQAVLSAIKVELGTTLEGQPVFAGRLRVEGDVAARSLSEHADLLAEWSAVAPDLKEPLRSVGKSRVHLDLTSGTFSAELTKEPEAADVAISAGVPSLSRLKAFGLPEHPAGLRWSAGSLQLDAKAHLDHLTSPVPRVHAQVDGVASHLERDGEQGDARAHAVADLDLARPALDLQVETSGAIAPIARVKAQAGFERASRKVVADIEAHASHLAGLPIPSLDPSKLEVDLKARAALRGVVQGLSPTGEIHLAPKPAESATGTALIDAQVANVKWEQEDQQAEVPAASLHVDARGEGAERSADISFAAKNLRVTSGDVQVDVTGAKAEVHARGRPQTGEASLQANLTAAGVDQDAAPAYAVGGLVVALSAEREKGGVIHVSEARVENPAAGTVLRLRGAVSPEDLPPKLALHATLEQDLAKVWRAPAMYQGGGSAAVTLAVESPDLHVFHSTARVALTGASIHLPKSGLIAEPIDAEVPIALTFARTASGFDLVRLNRLNPYSVLRFEDQHALLSGRSFLSIGKVEVPGLSISPLAGNLHVDESAVSLSQLEMGLRGGKIAGNCILDWDGWKSHLRADIRANGVQSSYGEPFDGNFAFVISAKDRTVDGHAEILRIGRRHLYDLLDLQDPHHVAPAFNRVRQALALGYPKHVRVIFDRGFARAQLSFGGLAALVRVDELRGIPVEPLIDKFISPQAGQTEEP